MQTNSAAEQNKYVNLTSQKVRWSVW